MNIKRNLIVLIKIIITLPVFSCNNDTITLPLHDIQVNDTLIYSLLDRAIIHEMLNNKRGNNTFNIRVDRNEKCTEFIIAYLHSEDRKIYCQNRCGYLIYKNNLFFISETDRLIFERFFLKKENVKEFEFYIPEGLHEGGAEETTWSYCYQDGIFVLNYLFE